MKSKSHNQTHQFAAVGCRTLASSRRCALRYGLSMRIVLLSLAVLLAGCYPINKTLQPGSTVVVQDSDGKPVGDATVTLVANAYPYGFEKTRMIVRTNYDGKAFFPRIKQWRIESLMIHGAEHYFWNWCVVKPGFSTYATDYRRSRTFEQNHSITLVPGETKKCPDYN